MTIANKERVIIVKQEGGRGSPALYRVIETRNMIEPNIGFVLTARIVCHYINETYTEVRIV